MSIASTKRCSSCRQTKSFDDFHLQGRRGRHSYCKVCFNARYRGKARKPRPAAVVRARNYANRYGLATSQVDALLIAQKGLCAICGKPPKRVCVDHNHKTRKVRGVLCSGCNLKLGVIENSEFRRRALAYLRRTG